MKATPLVLVVLLLGMAFSGFAENQEDSHWEVNGIRLEADQVERLASNISKQTVEAVLRLEGLSLEPEQLKNLEIVYYEISIDVYGEVVQIIADEKLNHEEKEKQVMDVILAGQARSTELVRGILDEAQYEIYRNWEKEQVAAFQERGLWSKSRGRRRKRR